jgi:hypothetical protein
METVLDAPPAQREGQTQKKPGTTRKPLADAAAELADPARKAFRREAAMQILSAYVARNGGFKSDDMEANMLRVWEYADVFVRLEDAPPPPPPVEFDVTASLSRPRPAARPASHPTDEWAVYDGDKRHRGFVTREEADFFAASRPGAKVVQVGGPATEAGRVAEPSVTA